MLRKKLENNNFIRAAVLGANIFFRYIPKKIYGAGFKSYVQLVPLIRFTSFQQSACFATHSLVILLLQPVVFNSYPNIN